MINLSGNELNIINAALKEYYEIILQQQRDLTLRINYLSNLGDEILLLEMDPLTQAIEGKGALIADIKSLWTKLNTGEKKEEPNG